eukprot:294863-Rhodomonas_salina.2
MSAYTGTCSGSPVSESESMHSVVKHRSQARELQAYCHGPTVVRSGSGTVKSDGLMGSSAMTLKSDSLMGSSAMTLSLPRGRR